MPKLKPGFLVVLLMLFAGLGLIFWKKSHPATQEVTTTTAAPGVNTAPTDAATDQVGATATATTPAAPPAGFGQKFTYFPDQPENGQLKGVIEFGASGFNAFAIELDKQQRWKLIDKKFDESHALEGEASNDVVLVKLKEYIAGIKSFGVKGKDIQFVMSSGAKMNPNTYKVKAALGDLGYVINAVTAEQEGKYSLLSAQPQSFVDKSFVVDIGSGNTKITWRENGQLKSVESFGAKYFEKGISDATVAADIAAKIKQVPQNLRQTCFIIGGVPFKLANEVREGKERYTTLAAPNKYDGKGDQKRISGLNIYNAIVQSSGTQTMVFDWESNFTIGYLINRQKPS